MGTSINLSNSRILYSALDLNNNQQLGGTKTNEDNTLNLNDGLSLFEMEEIDKKFGNNDGMLEYEEFAKAFNGNANYELTGEDNSNKSVLGQIYKNLFEAFQKADLKEEFGFDENQDKKQVRKKGGSITNITKSGHGTDASHMTYDLNFDIGETHYQIGKETNVITKTENHISTTTVKNDNGSLTTTIDNNLNGANVGVTTREISLNDNDNKNKKTLVISSINVENPTELSISNINNFSKENINAIRNNTFTNKEDLTFTIDGIAYKCTSITPASNYVNLRFEGTDNDGLTHVAYAVVRNGSIEFRTYNNITDKDENGKTFVKERKADKGIVLYTDDFTPKCTKEYAYDNTNNDNKKTITCTYCKENKIEEQDYIDYKDNEGNTKSKQTETRVYTSKKISNSTTNKDGSITTTISSDKVKAEIKSKNSLPISIQVSKPADLKISNIKNHNSKNMSLEIGTLKFVYDEDIDDNGKDDTYILKADANNTVTVKKESSKTTYTITTDKGFQTLIFDNQGSLLQVITQNGEKTTDVEDVEKTLKETTQYTYNENGTKKSAKTEYTDRPLDSKVMLYDENGNLESNLTTKFENGKSVVTGTKYSKDEDGNITKTIYSTKDGVHTTAVYKNDKLISKEIKNTDGTTTEETYNPETGKKVLAIISNKDGDTTKAIKYEYKEENFKGKDTTVTYETTFDMTTNTVTQGKYALGLIREQAEYQTTKEIMEKVLASSENTEEIINDENKIKETVFDYKYVKGLSQKIKTSEKTIEYVNNVITGNKDKIETTKMYADNGYYQIDGLFFNSNGKRISKDAYLNNLFILYSNDQTNAYGYQKYNNSEDKNALYNPNTFTITIEGVTRRYQIRNGKPSYVSSAVELAKIDCTYFANNDEIKVAEVNEEDTNKIQKIRNTKNNEYNPRTFKVMVPYTAKVWDNSTKTYKDELTYATKYYIMNQNNQIEEIQKTKYEEYNCVYIANNDIGNKTEGENNTFSVQVGGTTKYYQTENGKAVEITASKYQELNK